MSYQRSTWLSAVLMVGLRIPAAAQPPAASPLPAQPSTAEPAGARAVSVDNDFIHKQFGEEFTLLPISTPYVRDVDGDGVDDFIVLPKSKKPMLDAAEH